MAKVDMDRVNEYLIPENFIDESRFLNGMFKTRNFVEGTIMGGSIALILWCVIAAPFEAKLSITIGLAFPFFMLGLSGINGDAFSTFVFNAITWARTRGTMLYNNETRALAQAPLESMMETEGMNDKILDLIDSVKASAQKKRSSTPLVEGRDFVFAEDTDLAGNYLDEQEDSEASALEKAPQKVSQSVDQVMVVEAHEVDVSVETVKINTSDDASSRAEPQELFGASDSLVNGDDGEAEEDIGEDGELF